MNLTTTQKLFSWLIFSVLLALLPFILGIINLSSRGINVDIVTLLGRGELLLISTTLCAIALGELFSIAKKSLVVQLAGGMSFIIISISSSLYAHLLMRGDEMISHNVVFMSIGLFVLSVITSSVCIIMAESEQRSSQH
jgi:hypothetical protein